MNFDFYGLCAKYWNTTRYEAKLRVLLIIQEAGGDLNSLGSPGFDAVARLQPLVLEKLPNEARVETLAYYGFVVSDN